MSLIARVAIFIVGLTVLVFVINLLRTRRLQERYALLWVAAGLALTVSPLFADQLDMLGLALGFDYTPALLLSLAVIGLMLIIAQLSLSVSTQADHIKILTQELGILRQEIRTQRAGVPLEEEHSTPEGFSAPIRHDVAQRVPVEKD